MYRAPTDDSDSDIDTSAHQELRAQRPAQPANMTACTAGQRAADSPLFIRTRSNPLTSVTHTPPTAPPSSRAGPSSSAATGQPQRRRSSSSSGQQHNNSLKRPGLGESPSHAAKRMLSGLVFGCMRSGNAPQANVDCSGGFSNAPAQQQQQQQQRPEQGQQNTEQVDVDMGAAGCGIQASSAAATAATLKPDVMKHLRDWATRLQQQAPATAGSKRRWESADDVFSADHEHGKLTAAAGVAKFQHDEAAAARDSSGDDQQPSAPPIACLFAEQQQQQHSAHNQQASAPTGAAGAGAAAGSSSVLKRRLEQQDEQQQQQQRPKPDHQQQQQEWRWPSSREGASAASAPASDNVSRPPIIDLTEDAAAGSSAAPDADAHINPQPQVQQQQQQANKRAASHLALDAPSQLGAAREGMAKRLHTTAAGAMPLLDRPDIDMPQAAYVTHKRQQPEASLSPDTDHMTQQQQQRDGAHANKMSRHGVCGYDATAAAADSTTSGSEAVMHALQQSYPPLAAVLCAVRCGGLPAVLNSPYGGAVAAIMTQPAGQRLLDSFAQLAGDESLMAAALRHQQQQKEMDICTQNTADCSHHLGLSPSAAAAAAGSSAAAAAVGLASPSVQQALHHLHVSIATSQSAAAAALLADLNLAFDTYQQGLQVGSRVGVATQQQQQQQLLTELQVKLRVAEEQLQQQQKERQATEAAAAAAQHALHEAKEKLEHVTLCQICYEQPRDTVLMPCMHFLHCAKCMRQSVDAAAAAARSGKGECVVRCPVCRAAVSGQVVVHLSPQAADTVGVGGTG